MSVCTIHTGDPERSEHKLTQHRMRNIGTGACIGLAGVSTVCWLEFKALRLNGRT